MTKPLVIIQTSENNIMRRLITNRRQVYLVEDSWTLNIHEVFFATYLYEKTESKKFVYIGLTKVRCLQKNFKQSRESTGTLQVAGFP